MESTIGAQTPKHTPNWLSPCGRGHRARNRGVSRRSPAARTENFWRFGDIRSIHPGNLTGQGSDYLQVYLQNTHLLGDKVGDSRQIRRMTPAVSRSTLRSGTLRAKKLPCRSPPRCNGKSWPNVQRKVTLHGQKLHRAIHLRSLPATLTG